MVEKIELWLNIIHYCIYKVDYKLHMFSNKLNPFVLLGRIPRITRNLEKQGTTLVGVTNKVWTDRRFGFGIMVSGGGLLIIIFLIVWSVFLLLNSLLSDPINFSWLPFATCMGLAYLICHITVFKKDKYIRYFKKFDKWTKQKKWKNSLVALVLTIGVIALFIYSFRFIPKG